MNRREDGFFKLPGEDVPFRTSWSSQEDTMPEQGEAIGDKTQTKKQESNIKQLGERVATNTVPLLTRNDSELQFGSSSRFP